MTSRLFSAAFLAMFLAAVGWQLVAALGDKPLIDFARQLERIQSPGPPDADLAKRLGTEIERRTGCDHLLARSRVTVSVYLLEYAGSTDVDTFRRRLAAAEREAKIALACNPLDGNLWFVTGWLSFHLVPNKALLHEFLLNAIRFAPTNGIALERRWRVLAPHLNSLGFANDPAVVDDLGVLYRESDVMTVTAVHDMLLNNGSNALANTALSVLGSERRTAIERQLEVLKSKPRPREFLRFGPRTPSE